MTPPEPERRGDRPGGWREDEHGNLAFMLRNSEEEPAWACLLCRRGLLHTLAEHELAVDGTAR
jgi:hypothetical protein